MPKWTSLTDLCHFVDFNRLHSISRNKHFRLNRNMLTGEVQTLKTHRIIVENIVDVYFHKALN